jgi:hypothetical protein
MSRFRIQTRPGIILAVAILSLVALLIIPHTPHAAAKDGKIKIEHDKVKVGDIITTGTQNSDGTCDFGEVEILTDVKPGQKPKYLSLQADDNCQLIVAAKWNGNDAPDDIPMPDLDELQDKGTVIGGPETGNAGAAAPFGSQINIPRPAMAMSRISEAQIWTYGLPGPTDILAMTRGHLEYGFDGTNVWRGPLYPTCYGETWTAIQGYGWDWKVDSCNTKQVSVTTGIKQKFTGSYHCRDLDPSAPDPCSIGSGFYQTLTINITAKKDGSSTCVGSAIGTWFDGPSYSVVQGCS